MDKRILLCKNIIKGENQDSIRTIGIGSLGMIVGIVQKILDTLPANYLPYFIEQIQFSNHLGKLNTWVLMVTIIAVLSKNSKRAAVNTFVFLFFMLLSYYSYSYIVLGYLPYYEINKWLLACVISILFSILIKYSRNKSIMTFVVNVIITCYLFEPALLFLNNHKIKNFLDLIIFIIGVLALYSKTKIFVLSIIVSIVITNIYFYFIRY